MSARRRVLLEQGCVLETHSSAIPLATRCVLRGDRRGGRVRARVLGMVVVRLATRADLKACTTRPGPLAPVRRIRYVATLDIGIVNDRTALMVMHTDQAEAGRRVVLDRIVRWQGTRAAPVDLGEVRDTLLALTMEYNSAEVVLDPHQAVPIA